MTRMVEGDAAVALSELQASRDRQAALTAMCCRAREWRSSQPSQATRPASCHFIGYNLSTAVWVGLIAVAGVAAETGILMVVYLDEGFERHMREGRIHGPATWTRRWLKALPLAFGRSS